MQQLWQRGYKWDQELSPEVCQEWITFFEELEGLNETSFPRCLTPKDAVGLPILCIFSDASREAFGTCAYLRWQTANGKFDIRFVAAKSRVAPLKELSIPRLELQAAVLAARLYKTPQAESRLQFEKAIFFTDSAITHAWIRSQARTFKPFVSVRVGEIQSNSNSSQWRHSGETPGEFNVADDVSRGVPVIELGGRWKPGPEFLYQAEEDWPQDKSAKNEEEHREEEVQKECRRPHAVNLLTTVTTAQEVIPCKEFSSWRKLLRVTAYVRRFIANLKANIGIRNRTVRNDVGNPRKGALSSQELEEAETLWIIEAQQDLYARHAKGEFAKLSPFVDEDGVLRVGGRVDEAIVSYETRHPALLPNKHKISLLITRHMHQ